jgi:hypothetical protein
MSVKNVMACIEEFNRFENLIKPLIYKVLQDNSEAYRKSPNSVESIMFFTERYKREFNKLLEPKFVLEECLGLTNDKLAEEIPIKENRPRSLAVFGFSHELTRRFIEVFCKLFGINEPKVARAGDSFEIYNPVISEIINRIDETSKAELDVAELDVVGIDEEKEMRSIAMCIKKMLYEAYLRKINIINDRNENIKKIFEVYDKANNRPGVTDEEKCQHYEELTVKLYKGSYFTENNILGKYVLGIDGFRTYKAPREKLSFFDRLFKMTPRKTRKTPKKSRKTRKTPKKSRKTRKTPKKSRKTRKTPKKSRKTRK